MKDKKDLWKKVYGHGYLYDDLWKRITTAEPTETKKEIKQKKEVKK